MKDLSRFARRIVLGVTISGAVWSGVCGSVAAQTPASQVVALETRVTVPRQCTVTSSVQRLDAAAGGSTPGAVIAAIVAVCTRGSAQGISLHLTAPTPQCEHVPIPGGSATACGGAPAAAFVRTLPGNPSSETNAYVSVFDNASGAAAPPPIAIEF